MLQRANIVALLVAAGAVSPTLAYNALGHKVVAEIAWRELDPAARQNILDTLRRHPRFDLDFTERMTDDVWRADTATQDRWIFQHAARGRISPADCRQASATDTTVRPGTMSTFLSSLTHRIARRWLAN
jgi:hypothetical protein